MIKRAPAVQKQPLFSIGIFTGQSPVELKPPPNITNPVLTRRDVSDVNALFVADPFMIKISGLWYLFFEVYNGAAGKGEIGVATSANTSEWDYQSIVLSAPFHLSYPYVFRVEDDIYMIPESSHANSIRLYRAERFPFEWKFMGPLLSGRHFADSSILYHEKKWWLFTETNQELKHDTLRLFYSERLLDGWKEHALSPVVCGNPHIARPAGRIVSCGDRLIRYAQDCHPIYGTHVRAFEIRVSETRYEERDAAVEPLLGPSGSGWNADGMHHVDPHPLTEGSWVACVDGWRAVESLGGADDIGN